MNERNSTRSERDSRGWVLIYISKDTSYKLKNILNTNEMPCFHIVAPHLVYYLLLALLPHTCIQLSLITSHISHLTGIFYLLRTITIKLKSSFPITDYNYCHSSLLIAECKWFQLLADHKTQMVSAASWWSQKKNPDQCHKYRKRNH